MCEKKKKSLILNSQSKKISNHLETISPPRIHDQPLDLVTIGPLAQKTEGGVAASHRHAGRRSAAHCARHAGMQTHGGIDATTPDASVLMAELQSLDSSICSLSLSHLSLLDALFKNFMRVCVNDYLLEFLFLCTVVAWGLGKWWVMCAQCINLL
jgi:hypothetical protein